MKNGTNLLPCLNLSGILLMAASGTLLVTLQAAEPTPDKGPPPDVPTPPAGANSATFPAPKPDWGDGVRNHNAEAAKIASSNQLVFDGDSITSWFAYYSGPGNSGVDIWNERYAKLGPFNFDRYITPKK